MLEKSERSVDGLKKTKCFNNVRFKPEHLKEIAAVFRETVKPEMVDKLSLLMRVKLPTEDWEHDQEEEFFSDIRKDGAQYSYRQLGRPYDLIVNHDEWGADVVVETETRAAIESVFHVAEKLAPLAKLPDPPAADVPEVQPVRVFIGHGQNQQWRDLKDHIHEKHDYDVQAYEIGARTGHAIRDVLEEMLSSSSFAILVMTGEDETADGDVRARQNVVHEAGLFQGRLGFNRAIVLVEQGVATFSNIDGIQQIRFKRGSIQTTFGDVLATLKREC